MKKIILNLALISFCFFSTNEAVSLEEQNWPKAWFGFSNKEVKSLEKRLSRLESQYEKDLMKLNEVVLQNRKRIDELKNEVEFLKKQYDSFPIEVENQQIPIKYENNPEGMPAFRYTNENYVDRNIDLAVELCVKTRSDTGFLAAKSALLNCKDDFESVLFLKMFMCLCKVSGEHEDELLKIAEDVINGPSPSLFTAIAWYQKGNISVSKCEYNKALNFFEIALYFFKQEDYKKIEDRLCYREFYEFLIHNENIVCFKALNKIDECNKELNFLKENYKWLNDDFIEKKKQFIKNISLINVN